MSAESSKSDIIIAIHPQHVANIVKRFKNHEFRKYLLPPQVQRLWIYETSPASAIKYVATISSGKRPGEIGDPSGLRNDEFDQGLLEHIVKYAYEIRKLEALPKCISLGNLKENDWLNGPPQKYCYVKATMKLALNTIPLTLIFDSAASGPLSGPASLSQSLDKTEPEQELGSPRQNQETGGLSMNGPRGTVSLRTRERLSWWQVLLAIKFLYHE